MLVQVKKLVDSARERAVSILSSHEADLHLLATTLLDKETMSGTQARALPSTHGVSVVRSWHLGCSCNQALLQEVLRCCKQCCAIMVSDL